MKGLIRGGVLLALLCVVAGNSQATFDYATGPGTVEYALSRPDGARVSLTMVVIGRIDTSQRQGISVHEWWDKTTSIAVLFDPTLGLKTGQTIDIEGRMTTLPSRARAVVCQRIALYLDRWGYVVDAVPPLKGLFEPSVWPFRGWIPVQQAAFSSMSALAMTPLDDPEPPPIVGEPSESELVFTPGTIPWAKSLPDGDPVALIGQIVTASRGQVDDCIYIQEQDRSSGIRVVTEDPVAVGDVVQVMCGKMATTVHVERFIAGSSVRSMCTGSLQPSGIINRDIGGFDFVYDDQDGSGQRGVLGGVGLNNIGSLVKTWGTVTCDGGSYVYIDDGSALNDGTQTSQVDNIGVRVVAGSGATLPEFESIVELTGISSCMIPEGEEDPIRLLRIPTPVMHVDADGNDGDGLSWENAKTTVGAAIEAAVAGQEIWVAEGTYPECITIDKELRLYGGFDGDESDRDQRDWHQNVATLDGDEDGSVVTCPEEAGESVIDGFTITHGVGDNGGGINCDSSSPMIAHNTIAANTANGGMGDAHGGGICCLGGSPTIVNNLIATNSVESGSGASMGGGVYLSGCSSARIVNNTIAGNEAVYPTGMSDGGGIYIAACSPIIADNIIAFNTSGIYTSCVEPPDLAANCVYYNPDENGSDYIGLYAGPTDISANPSFVNQQQGDYHLASNSPCKNVGDNSVVATGSDIDGEYRIQSGVVDIGADEVNSGCVWYRIALSAALMPAEMGTDADVTAIVYDPSTGSRIDGVAVTFSVEGGTLGDAEVDTDDGVALTTVTRSTMGYVRVTASVPVCGNDVSQSVCAIWFSDPDDDNWPMFQHDIAHTGVSGCSLSDELEKKWQIELAGDTNGTLWSSPVVVDGWVYVGTNNPEGTLYALRVDNTDLCTRDLGSPIHGTPCVADGRVYIGTEDGVLQVLYAGDQPGHQPLDPDWMYECPLTDEQIVSSITIYEGAAYFGTYYPYDSGNPHMYGRLRTVDLTTHEDRASSPATTRYQPMHVAPAIDTGFATGARVYASDMSCWVTAAQCSDGLKKWEWKNDPAAMYSSPVVYDGHIFVGAGTNYVYRLADNSNLQGTYEYHTGPYDDDFSTTSGHAYSTAAAWNGSIFFGCSNGKLYRVDTSTLVQTWAADLLAPVTSSPLLSAPTGLLFASTDAGEIYLVDATDGSGTLLYDTSDDIADPTIKSSPAAAAGCLFIVAGNDSGRNLYCFGL